MVLLAHVEQQRTMALRCFRSAPEQSSGMSILVTWPTPLGPSPPWLCSPHPFSFPELNPMSQMSHDWLGTGIWTQPSADTSGGWGSCYIKRHKPLAQRISAYGHLTPQNGTFMEKKFSGRNRIVLELEDQRAQAQGSV